MYEQERERVCVHAMVNVGVVDYVDSGREYELDTKRTKKKNLDIFLVISAHYSFVMGRAQVGSGVRGNRTKSI